MAAAAVECGPTSERSWGRSNRVKRTEAMPAHSLFGSSLQSQDDQLTAEMRSIDLEAYDKQKLERNRKPKPELPDSLKERLPGNAILEHSKEQLQIQKRKTERARKLMNGLEQKAKYFELPHNVDAASDDKKGAEKEQWMSVKDLERSDEINKVGLKGHTYNYDKYQPKPPNHQYALVGNVFYGGNDIFAGHNNDFQAHPAEAYKGQRIPKRRPHPVDNTEMRPSHSAPPSAMDLPPNIRHQFGTKICSAVLNDTQKVQSALDEHKRLREMLQRKRKPTSVKTSAGDNAAPEYESLGRALRQNVCPGYTYDHKTSTSKSDYTKEVHESRVPDPDEYRYQRDELSQWNEHYYLQKRQRKDWELFEESKPKFKPNWDRDAKRPPPAPKAAAPKPKPKPKAKPEEKPNPADDVLLEDIEFVTPPLTPPPPKREKAPVALMGDGLKDDDFWGFYDQPLPLP